ncbi:MAG: hypothetical protein J0L69_13060 [Bacteroidetes bacterium]|nr:hypothetical protein [Bacteroidota bacterium]
MSQWLDEMKEIPPVSHRVLITAFRNYTWIEWALYSACVLRKKGFSSTILYKGSEIKTLYNNTYLKQFWSKAKNISDIEFIDLETLAFDKSDFNYYYKNCEKDEIAALAYNYHIESQDITDNINLYREELEALMTEASANAARVKNLLSNKKYHQFICYSGIIWDTPLILKAALDSNQETVCVEGWAWRAGHMIYNFNAPALEYNVKGWMKHFGAWDKKKEGEMNSYFGFLDGKKQNDGWLKTFHKVQRAKVTDEIPKDITDFLKGDQKVFLLACNVIGDSSLLNRETIFKSHKDFIQQTIEYFRQNKDIKLVIRIHPAEEWVKSKVKIRLGHYANKMSEGLNNVLVVNSNVKLNTFSLIPFIHVGLVWVSSVGADLVARGVPVILAAATKYYGLGIGDEPKTIDEYFTLLNKYKEIEHKPSPEQIQKAKEYLYMVFKGFSFEAQGRSFRADTCKLGKMPSQEEHDKYFQILLKQIPAPDLYYETK